MKKVTKYQAVKNYIKVKIKNGEYLPEEKLPNENEISKTLDVSSITVKKAMMELVNEGIIYRIKGKGSYIKDLHAIPKPNSKKLVAFILSCQDVNDSSFMKIMIGMQRCLSPSGYSLIIENPGDDPEKELQIIKQLIDNQVEAFIIYSANPEKSVGNYVFLRKKNIPFVLMDRWTGYFPANSVSCNNHDGAFSAVEYLIELQHKKIGFVADNFYLSSEKERFEGYCDAMHFASLKVKDSLFFTDTSVDYDRMIDSIKSKEITALFAVNDRRGLELINALTDRGVNIPVDVSIIGFDDYETSRLARVPLSTVRQHFEEEGYYAAQILLDSISGSKLQFNKILIGTQLVVRSSTTILNTI